MKRLRWTVLLLAAAGLLGGCGEVTNQLTPRPGTANTITVALDAPPNFTQVGIVEAQALGLFAQTDLSVRFIVAPHPIVALTSGRAQIAISNEPQIILTRNGHTALASVAAILQGPQHILITCRGGTSGSPGTSTTGTTTTASGHGSTRTAGTGTATSASAATATVPRSHPPLHAKPVRPERCRATVQAHPVAAYAEAPTYNALNLVVTEDEIVAHAPVLRRFVQAVARGYAAARRDPVTATANLVRLHPGLDTTEQLTGVEASLSDFFPSGASTSRPWGWQVVSEWNAFGSYLLDHHVIDNVNAVPDADTNELLAGQGV